MYPHDDGAAEQEQRNDEACYETAVRNGHTVGEAEECDDGNVGCPDCPFLVDSARR